MKNVRSAAVSVASALFLSALQADALDWTGKRVSVLGDSYSSFGSGGYYPGKTDVRNESQMWYSRVISHFGGTLERNNSVRGSAISYTYGVCPSFGYRARADMPGDPNCGLGDPDVIMVMGGLNDFWVLEREWGLTISAFLTGDYYSGLRKLFAYLDSAYPGAEKIVILGKIHSNDDYKWGLAPKYRNAIRQHALEYGFRVVDLEGGFGMDADETDAREYPHPTAKGQSSIAARVISSLESEYGYSRLFDYLETDSSGYMVTDCIPNLASTEIAVRMRLFDPDAPSTNTVFSADGYSSGFSVATNRMSLAIEDGSLVYMNAAAGRHDIYMESPLPAAGGLVSVSVRGDSLAVCNSTFESGQPVAGVDASGHLVIGGVRTAGLKGSPYAGTGPKKIYGISVSEGGALVHDYVPAKDLEGRATLYDRITGSCLAVYNGVFNALDFDGAYVNYTQCRAYSDLPTAYAEAHPGETVTVRESGGAPVSFPGRVGVCVDTRGFPGITMLAPDAFHKVFKNGNILYIGDNDEVVPHFSCGKASDIFALVDGRFSFSITNVISDCEYIYYATTDLSSGWTIIARGVGLYEFSIAPPQGVKSFFIKAEVVNPYEAD